MIKLFQFSLVAIVVYQLLVFLMSAATPVTAQNSPISLISAATQSSPTPFFTPTPSLEAKVASLENKVNELEQEPKDMWDKISAVSGLVSGGVVAIIGILATYVYNERQRKNSEGQKLREIAILQVQTVQSFMPQLQSGNPKAVEAALLAITALGNSKLATDLATLYKSEGAISALSKMASSPDQESAENARKSLSNIYESLRMAVVEIRGDNLFGSGFLITENGYIITADFVVGMFDDNANIAVEINGKMYPAKKIKVESTSHLALIKVDNGNFPSLQIIENPEVDYFGDVFILGPKPDLGGWVITTGKITGKDLKTEESAIELISTDAQISPGFAGAPAVNRDGQVIGMAFATHMDRWQHGERLSLLIPSRYIFQIMQDITQTR